MAKAKRAKLTIFQTDILGGKHSWCRLTAKNGELLMFGESVSNPSRARAAIIRAMVDVLIAEGFTVVPPEDRAKGERLEALRVTKP